MFTGLVETTGEVDEIEDAGEGKRIKVKTGEKVEDISVGDSVSVCGVCLTVEDFSDDSMSFFLAGETLEKTWFSRLQENDVVNLERSLRAGDRMGGHQVQGHVETVGKVLDIDELEEGWEMKFELPQKIENYVIEKGFITVEGISLTANNVDENSFSVAIIPETWNVTNLSEKSVGDRINLESDPTGRYIEKMVEKQIN